MNGDGKSQSSRHVDDSTNGPGRKTDTPTNKELADGQSEIEPGRGAVERRLVEMPAKRDQQPNSPVVTDDVLEQLRDKDEEGFSEEQWRDLFTLHVKRIAAETDLVGAQPRLHLTDHYNFVPQAQRRVLNHTDIPVSQNYTTPTRVLVLLVGRRRES